VNASVRQLFSELVDLPRVERDLILADRGIAADVCAELASLMECDSGDGTVTRQVNRVMGQALSVSLQPERCGQYRLIRPIGSGGMGTVYLAARDDGEIERQVAIKLLRVDEDRPAWRKRFLQERQLLASMNHPSIARLFDAGHTADGRPYLVMEFVDGIAIDEYARTLDWREKSSLFLAVCEGVAHAHKHSIIHRDLKPSNILVDASGRPKLLDFGIGKVLSAHADQTRTVERLLTPAYASPEQLRGEIQGVATDVYSLGAVLYRLVTGRAPRESPDGEQQNITAPSRLNSELPRDLDYVVLKALRWEPSERYASADAMADDIRALLESRPVQARSGDRWHRICKFARRNRVSVAGAGFALASLYLGTAAVNHHRAIAEDRSLQGRQLVRSVLALGEATGGLHDFSSTRYELANLSKEYLEELSAGGRKDQKLSLEIGRAYSVLARAQGITAAANGDRRRIAEDNLRRAGDFVNPILTAQPGNREALLAGARISHDRMIVAEAEHLTDKTVAEARKTVGYLDRLMEGGSLSRAEAEPASEFFYQIALTHKNLHLFDEGIRYSRRSIEISRSLRNSASRVSLGLSMLADLYRLTGEPERALHTIREAQSALQQANFPGEAARCSARITLLWREAKILGGADGLSLNRPAEAIAVLQEAFDVTEEWARDDPEGSWSRLYFASLGRELGELLRLRNPQKALAIYDQALLRLHEIRDNPEARRGEAQILAGSAYALRRLGRTDEAKRRIEAAFRLLDSIQDFPALRIAPRSPADLVLRAMADHLAETGQPQRAAELFTDLLGRVEASHPDPQNDLRHAAAVSQIYGSLAGACRRAGLAARESEFSTRRLELWRNWERKLGQSQLVRRQLAMARLH
jgi:serine/threonine protein kinase